MNVNYDKIADQLKSLHKKRNGGGGGGGRQAERERVCVCVCMCVCGLVGGLFIMHTDRYGSVIRVPALHSHSTYQFDTGIWPSSVNHSFVRSSFPFSFADHILNCIGKITVHFNHDHTHTHTHARTHARKHARTHERTHNLATSGIPIS